MLHYVLKWGYGEHQGAVRSAESVGLSEAFPGRGVLLERAGAHPMAKRKNVSGMPKANGICADAALVSVQCLPRPGVGHRRDDVSKEPFAAAEMVLGDLSDGHLSQGGLDE